MKTAMKSIMSLLMVATVAMAATSMISILIGADATSEAPNGDFTHHITKNDINVDKCYWMNKTGAIETACTDPKPDNANILVNYIAGSNATNYTIWADTAGSINTYCNFYVVDVNGANRQVPIGANNSITLCTDCMQNFSVYGYVVFKNVEGIQSEEYCKIKLVTDP